MLLNNVNNLKAFCGVKTWIAWFSSTLCQGVKVKKWLICLCLSVSIRSKPWWQESGTTSPQKCTCSSSNKQSLYPCNSSVVVLLCILVEGEMRKCPENITVTFNPEYPFIILNYCLPFMDYPMFLIVTHYCTNVNWFYCNNWLVKTTILYTILYTAVLQHIHW